MNQNNKTQLLFAVCIDNSGYPASLELYKIYRVLPDDDAAADGDLRVVDESFELESFGLPDIDSGQKEWGLVFEHKESGHYFCIMMNEWNVEGIRIDG